MQTMRTQLAVIGGGPAGVCAAIAAGIDDPDDLAKRASVSASSVHPGHPGGATG